MDKVFNVGIKFVPVGETLELIRNGGALILSEGYVDYLGVVHPSGEKGKYVRYVESRTDKGIDRAKRFKFDSSLLRIMTRETDTDIYGVSQYKWLKNYPTCEGSPYGTYDENGQQVNVQFREMNEAKDAAIALEAESAVTEAKLRALRLDEKTLIEVAAHIGHFGPPNDIMRLTVVEFASKRPTDFNAIMKSGDREVRSAIRIGLANSILKRKGSMIYWNDTVLGADEDAAVAKLYSDPDMFRALQAENEKGKRSRGNPNFKKKATEQRS